MNPIDAWMQTSIVRALGWTLFHSLWEGAIVALALAAALYVIHSPRARHAAACLALAGMLAGFGLTLGRLMLQQPIGDSAAATIGGLEATFEWARRTMANGEEPNGAARGGFAAMACAILDGGRAHLPLVQSGNAGWLRGVCAGQECVARPISGSGGSISLGQACGSPGPWRCSNPAWLTYPSSSVICAR
jgi:hypothetical protein